MYRVLAETVVLVHFAFVPFVVLGGLLALKWRRIAWAHVPAAVWGVVVEFSDWVCPLTALEGWLRADLGDRPHRVVLPLDAPARHRGVVHGAVERQVHLHVPLEVVHDRPDAADALHRGGLVGHVVWRSYSSVRAGSPSRARPPRTRPGRGRSRRASRPVACTAGP
ncbi:MAG: DUF2784 domain-containing protein [Deltaproteobacteria bacterium]|nr:MAG: DUF2784 domain-containing protein [Deltaproteobacteria bacterium]